jgi:hypothetical protein
MYDVCSCHASEGWTKRPPQMVFFLTCTFVVAALGKAALPSCTRPVRTEMCPMPSLLWARK